MGFWGKLWGKGGKRVEIPEKNVTRSVSAANAEIADKIRLSKNKHKYYQMVPWGMTTLYEGESQELRQARWMIRNEEEQNGLVAVMLTKASNNVVGPKGFQLQAATGNHEFNKQIQKAWNRWTRNADSTGCSWQKHQWLKVRECFRDGEGGVVNMYNVTNPDTGQPFKIDVLVPFEATDLPAVVPSAQPHAEGNRIVDGIEYDAIGRPVYYYISTLSGLGAIPAEHVAVFRNMQKTSNSRGLPALLPCIGMVENLNGLADAELMASKLSAQTVWHQHHASPVQMPNINGQPVDLTSPVIPVVDTNGQPVLGEDGQQVTQPNPWFVSNFFPGDTIHTQGQDDFDVVNPAHPNPNFNAFFLLFCRIIAANVLLPAEQVLNYWGETNYSSGRASMLETQRAFEAFQAEFAHAYLAKIYRWKVQQWLEDGTLKLPEDVDVEDVFEHLFIGPKFPFLDPQKELAGYQAAIDIGLETRKDLLAMFGKDYDTWLAQRSEEVRREREAGLDILHSQAFVPATPSISTNPTQKPMDEEGNVGSDVEEPEKEVEGDTEESEGEEL